MVEETEAKLRSSEGHVFFLEDKVPAQSNKFLERDAGSSAYQEPVTVLK